VRHCTPYFPCTNTLCSHRTGGICIWLEVSTHNWSGANPSYYARTHFQAN
jgi:hypothetical protein